MKAVLLVAESNKLKARFSFNSTDYFNRITLILADGTPWQITTPQPTKKYDFYTEFDYGENVTFPKVKDASMHKFSLLIYSYKDYKINFTTSMQELNRYDPGVNALIALLSDLVPSDYSLSGIFKGGPNDTLLIRKTKLEEKPVIATSINNAKFNVFLTTRDFALVKGEYYVVNTELNKYLELEIPKEAIFWGAILDDAPLDVYGEGEKILIPLKTSEKIGSAYSQMHLMFFYVVPNGIFMKGTPDSFIFITPKQNVPVSKVEVKISIPSEFLVLWIETKPSARTKIVSYRPTLMRTPIQIVKYGLGSETSETIGIAKSLSVESPVEKVELTIRGVPIEFQIPESNRYALIEMELLMPSEELSIVLYGQENAWIFFIFIIFIILVITYWKRKIVIKYLKKIW
ncbi:MAG: hypothetical protein QXP04_00540, partial [Candidatus Nanoarchaeia archaeon]|nr:hypothetical protein [Candidatus Jingweiarchaeum tengchongense]